MKILEYSASDSVRFRMFVAQALDLASSRIQATVIGEHGYSQVLLFSSMRLGGKPVSLGRDVEKWIRQQVAGIPKILEAQRVKTGWTATWTTSMGIMDMCRAIAEGTENMIPCSTPLEGEYDYRDMAMSVPVILGRGGVREILEWDLTSAELIELDRSVEAIRPMLAYVDDFMKNNALKEFIAED